ncbi:hypothetical protein [Ostreibacterium oceani]|uniref:DUF8202 domain-containing protein n=1 Tax=Ostreibacterium oceani TaxID=2654998 RepID=A0A6N7EUZ3_9GAMM|nr:hypothetical protein [Ostreibacterium oceani]MPV86594.1 hypothetical protein [Ostreibacterium oceani]
MNVYWSYGSPFTPPQRQNAPAPFSVGDAAIGQYRQDFTNNNKSYAIDGNQQQSGGGTLSSNGADQITLGGITVTGGPRFYNGKIPEYILYTQALSQTETNKVESYLALKYGIRLGGSPSSGPDYIASDGTVFRSDASTTNATVFNVFGIGRDDTSGLHQRVSKSQEPSAILTAATSADFTSSNLDASRTDLDTDLEFVTHAVSTDAALARTAFEVAPNYIAANKTWFIQETGDVAPVQYQVEVSNLALLSYERLYAVVATNMSGTPVIEYIPATVASNLASFEVDWPANTTDNRMLLAVCNTLDAMCILSQNNTDPAAIPSASWWSLLLAVLGVFGALGVFSALGASRGALRSV